MRSRYDITTECPSAIDTQQHVHFPETPSTSERRLDQLPEPILLHIYSHLAHPRHQIAFTLACRRFTAVAVASPISLRYAHVRHNGKPSWYGKEHALIDLKAWSWIPEGLKLCKLCLKYLPRNRIWKLNDGREIRSLKTVDWMWTVGQWMNGGSSCPTCQVGNAHDWTEEFEEGRETWTQCWGEGFVQNVMVKRGFIDEGVDEE